MVVHSVCLTAGLSICLSAFLYILYSNTEISEMVCCSGVNLCQRCANPSISDQDLNLDSSNPNPVESECPSILLNQKLNRDSAF